jgi:2-polyprenyl-3-methyl-5-hydroxy-6-metoxy-1,4-benzoquinol methylase
MLISKEYQELCSIQHKIQPEWGEQNLKETGIMFMFSRIIDTEDVLDYGCGKGKLAQSFPFPVKEYDPAILGKENGNVPSKFVVCHDVLEHIEPEYLMNVLKDLYRCTMKFAYITVSTTLAETILSDGRNAHLIVQSREWWTPHIEKFFTILGCTEIIKDNGHNDFSVLVVPKKDIEKC